MIDIKEQENRCIGWKLFKNRLVEAVLPHSEAEAQNTSYSRNNIRQWLKSSLIISNGMDIRISDCILYLILGQMSGRNGTGFLGKYPALYFRLAGQ